MGSLFKYKSPIRTLTLEQVILRLKILQLICSRGYQEMAWNEGYRQSVDENLLFPLPDWVWEQESELEQWEIQCLVLPMGQLSNSLISRATWLCEGIAVLLWGLQLDSMPSFEMPIAPLKVISKPSNDEDWNKAVLRPMEELKHYAENVFAWQARFRSFCLGNPVHTNFVEQAQQYGFDIDLIPIINQDVSILNKPIFDEKEIIFEDNFLEVASERFRAIKWLCGLDSTIYSEIDV